MPNESWPQGDELAVAFSQHVLRLQVILDRSLAPMLARQGLTRAEFDVLGALRGIDGAQGLRPKSLVARLLLTTGGLSNVLRRLENRGLVSRVPDPSDGRSQNVRLTDEGTILANATAALGTAALTKTLAAASSETLAKAFHELRPILAAVDDNPPRVLGPRTSEPDSAPTKAR